MFRYKELSTLRKLILFKKLIASSIKVVSGAIASFVTKAAGKAISVLDSIEPIQEGSGTPSPTNIRPISGRTDVVTSRCGVNVWDGRTSLTQKYINNQGAEVNDNLFSVTDYTEIVGGATYYISPIAGYSASCCWYDENKQFISGVANGGATSKTLTAPSNAKYIRVSFHTADASSLCINYPSTATDYEAYNGTSYTTDLGRTVYGGTLDVVSGLLTVDRGYIASYNGETLPSTWISDRDEYASGTTPTIGAEVVYELATPTTIQLTPQEVELLKGTNNLWCDSGDIEVNYYADIQKYIDKKLS